MLTFTAKIEIIGINPFVYLPEKILMELFRQANKNKGPIPVKGKIGGHDFIQHLIKYQGAWRLYLNTPMRKNSNTVVGDKVKIEIAFDPAERITPMHPKLKIALEKNVSANKIFKSLSPSLQMEVKRYINNLKTEESIDRNVKKAIGFLLGKERWIGRDKPQ